MAIISTFRFKTMINQIITNKIYVFIKNNIKTNSGCHKTIVNDYSIFSVSKIPCGL